MAHVNITSTTPAQAIAQGHDVDPGVDTDDYRTKTFIVKNVTGTQPVYLGKDTTEASAVNGFAWAASDGTLTIDLEPGETLYGLSAGATQTLHTLEAGR